MFELLAATAFDPSTFLVEQAWGLGGDVTGLLIKAVGAGASLYVARVGVKKIRERVKDGRQLHLPAPVGSKYGRTPDRHDWESASPRRPGGTGSGLR